MYIGMILLFNSTNLLQRLPSGSVVKTNKTTLPANAGDAGDVGTILALGRSPEEGNTLVFFPGEVHGQRRLEGAVHGVTKKSCTTY